MKKDEREYHENLERRLRAILAIEDEVKRLGSPVTGEMLRYDDDGESGD